MCYSLYDVYACKVCLVQDMRARAGVQACKSSVQGKFCGFEFGVKERRMKYTCELCLHFIKEDEEEERRKATARAAAKAKGSSKRQSSRC